MYGKSFKEDILYGCKSFGMQLRMAGERERGKEWDVRAVYLSNG